MQQSIYETNKRKKKRRPVYRAGGPRRSQKNSK